MSDTVAPVNGRVKDAPPPQVLGRRVGTGAMWSAANAGVLRLSGFVVNLIIAHLVAPFDFGVFAVALTVYNVVVSFSGLGVGSAIVRHPGRTEEIAPTIFTISLLSSALLSIGMVALAPFVAHELGASGAATAIRILAIVVLLDGVTTVPVAVLSREFMQRQQFAADVMFFVSSTTVMLVLVAAGHPVLGLALSRVAGQIMTAVTVLWLSPERYLPGFRWGEAKSLLAFGLPLAASSIALMVATNIDFIVIAHHLGARDLGYYTLAFSIASWPVSIFSAVMMTVTFPTLSRVRHDPVELERHMEAGLSALVSVSFPVAALLAALSPVLIDTVYGHRWHAASTALMILAIFGAAQTVLSIFWSLLLALGRTWMIFFIQLVWICALTPAMIVGVRLWGIAGAGVAHAVVIVVVVVPAYLWAIRRETPAPLASLARALFIPGVASAAAAVLAYASTHLVTDPAWRLLLGCAVGGILYLAFAGRWLLSAGRQLRVMYWQPAVPTGASGIDEQVR